MKKLTSILGTAVVILVFLFVLPGSVHAKIELSFSSPPSEIKGDESFSIDVTISGAEESSEYYIRGVFYKPNTTKYFGFTQNNVGEWHSEQTQYIHFFKITGNSTEQILFKPDTDSAFYEPNTGYLFKIGRYTPGGSLTWTDQSPAVITIKSDQPLSTPTPALTPFSSSTPLPTATPIVNTDLSVIQLSEVMACPSEDSEWIELFNSSDHPVTLQNLKIKDNTDSRSIDVSTTINAHGYFVLRLSSSILNNAGDSVRLFSPQGVLLAQMSYTDCQAGTSFIQENNTWQATTDITPGSANRFLPLASGSVSLTELPEVHDEETLSTASVLSQSSNTISLSAPEIEIKDRRIASESAIYINTLEKGTELNPTAYTLAETETKRHFSLSNAFLLAGGSYVLSATLLAQKWYNLSLYAVAPFPAPP
jgi:hypothetical protein